MFGYNQRMEQREDLANNKPLALEHKPHSSRTFESSQAWPPAVRPADRNIRLPLLWGGAGEPFLHLVTRAVFKENKKYCRIHFLKNVETEIVNGI